MFENLLTKLWQNITTWFLQKSYDPITLIKKTNKKQRFLLVQNHYHNHHLHQSNSIIKNSITNQSNIANTIIQSQEQPIKIYSLTTIRNNQQIYQQQLAKQNDDFISDLRKMNQLLHQIHQKQQNILQNSTQLTTQLNQVLTTLQSITNCQQQQKSIYKNYTKIITQVRQLKYLNEVRDYPPIDYDQFKKVISIWNMKENQAKCLLVKGCQHLSYSHLRLLSPPKQLNDQIICQYISQINTKLSQNQSNTYLILDSLKVTSIFNNTDYTKIQKILKKQKVTKQHILILAIHKIDHWLFLKIQNNIIYIYDSMIQNNTQKYINFMLISKIVKFAQVYYGCITEIQRVSNFPQQRNGYDCGMMMLCGIKDVVRNYRNWSFSQSDITYKRVLLTLQLLQRKLTGL